MPHDDWDEKSGVVKGLADHEARLTRVQADVGALTEAVGVLERAEAAGIEWRKTVATREQVAEVHSDVRALRTAWAAQVRPPAPPATNGAGAEAETQRAVGRIVLSTWKVWLPWLLVALGGAGTVNGMLRPHAPSAPPSSASAPLSPP